MGQLVFQAALGGQVALSGPNTASSFTVAVPAVTGTMVTTGDTATVTSTMISGPLTSAVGGTGVNNGSATLTLAGNVSHTGAFTQTIAATANTSVTLPTSGTLISSTTALSGAVTGTPSSTTYLRGDGTWATVSVSPGGSTTQVQYNNAGAFGGSANFTFNGTTVTMANDASINGLTVGRGAGAVSTNTAVGASALAANTGAYNSAVGASALAANTSGNYNQAFGNSALLVNTTGSSNSAMGQGALGANTTGSNNSAFGYYALVSNTTASSNVAVGYQSGYSNTTGTANVFLGSGVGFASHTTGSYNTLLGVEAGYNHNGSNNVGVGYQSLRYTTASGNTAVGYQALYTNTTGVAQTAIGYLAGYSATTGQSNVFIGYQAGNSPVATTTGLQNVYIGTYAVGSAATNQAEIVIGYSVTGKGSNTGFIAPGSSGGMYQGNNSAAWSITSDQRLKKNIVDNNVGLDKVIQIQVRNFEYRTEDEVTDLPKNQAIKKQGVQLGAIAQELAQVLPDCVKTESTGVMSVDTTNITWHLINAVKELSAELNALKLKVGV